MRRRDVAARGARCPGPRGRSGPRARRHESGAVGRLDDPSVPGSTSTGSAVTPSRAATRATRAEQPARVAAAGARIPRVPTSCSGRRLAPAIQAPSSTAAQSCWWPPNGTITGPVASRRGPLRSCHERDVAGRRASTPATRSSVGTPCRAARRARRAAAARRPHQRQAGPRRRRVGELKAAIRAVTPRSRRCRAHGR